MDLAERLDRDSMPEPNSGCLLWTAGLANTGYGQLYWDGGPKNAHRLAWIVANGPIPAGQHVLHKCDVRSCLNPAHLFLGTQRDNMRDMRAKGRGVDPVTNLGEAHHSAKLTADKVRKIRVDPRPSRAVATDYGVHPTLIQLIRKNKIWRHV